MAVPLPGPSMHDGSMVLFFSLPACPPACQPARSLARPTARSVFVIQILINNVARSRLKKEKSRQPDWLFIRLSTLLLSHISSHPEKFVLTCSCFFGLLPLLRFHVPLLILFIIFLVPLLPFLLPSIPFLILPIIFLLLFLFFCLLFLVFSYCLLSFFDEVAFFFFALPAALVVRAKRIRDGLSSRTFPFAAPFLRPLENAAFRADVKVRRHTYDSRQSIFRIECGWL